ncbi:hypothetical protein FKW77_005409 [Venturia effusa]|uniref:Uncharacterized protein n=1 Tax=Venturia effusa TaxID=50376 RepID=A0A517LFI0_9PEZI|nr:hypothetical protein FKW77_005409 [Venturia effusa]
MKNEVKNGCLTHLAKILPEAYQWLVLERASVTICSVLFRSALDPTSINRVAASLTNGIGIMAQDAALDSIPLPSMIPTPSMGEEEFQSLIECYSTNINASYTFLREIFVDTELGPLIEQKWERLSVEQQCGILEDLWGPVSHNYRADVESYMANSNPTISELYGTVYACPVYAPSLSLTTNGALMRLMRARGQNEPAKFARGDLLAYPFHVLTRPQIPSWADKFCMLLEEDSLERASDHYGGLIPVDTVIDPWGTLATRRVYRCFEGVAVLRSQVHTYFFLENCCREILAYDSDQAAPPPISTCEQMPPSLIKPALDAPYEPCSTILEAEQIRLLIHAQCDATIDHLRALQSDPSYYRRIFNEYSDHFTQITRDQDRNSRPEWQRPPPGVRSVLSRSLVTAMEEVAMWNTLSNLVEDCPQTTNTSNPLCPWVCLRWNLELVASSYIDRLKESIITGSPALECRLRGQPLPDNPSQFHNIRFELEDIQDEDLAPGLLMQILVLRRRSVCYIISPGTIISSIGIALNRSSTVKKHVSRHNNSLLSTLAILYRCINLIDLALPRAADHAVEEDEPLTVKVRTSRSVLDLIDGEDDPLKKLDPEIIEMGDPNSGEKFKFPENASNKREAVETMIRAEQALDKFWQALKTQYMPISLPAAKTLYSKPMDDKFAQRTEAWSKSGAKALPKGKKGKKNKSSLDKALILTGNVLETEGLHESQGHQGSDKDSGLTSQWNRPRKDSLFESAENSESDLAFGEASDQSLPVEVPVLNTPRWYSALKPLVYDDPSLHARHHNELIDHLSITAKYGIPKAISTLVTEYVGARQRWLDARMNGRFAPTRRARLVVLLNNLSLELSREFESPTVVDKIDKLFRATQVDMKMVQGAYNGGDGEHSEPESEMEDSDEAPDQPLSKAKPRLKKRKKAKPKRTGTLTPEASDEEVWEEVERLAAENETERVMKRIEELKAAKRLELRKNEAEYLAARESIQRQVAEKESTAAAKERMAAVLKRMEAADALLKLPDSTPRHPRSSSPANLTFTLEPRLAGVFKTLFWVPGQPIPTLFKWQDFVDALQAIHLEADHLYGSTWLFHAQGRGILFQEAPYEAPASRNMSLAVSRNYGRRLNKWYGIELEDIRTEGEEE